jgi:hypothetical protein
MKALVVRQQLKGFSTTVLIFAGLFLTINLTGCLDSGSGSEAGTDVVANPSNTLPPLTTPERTVCDPFNAGVSARDRGLVGNLLYLTDDLPRYTDVQSYIDNGTPIQSTLYFDQLFVPTRAFDLGFYTQDGTLITNINNEPIYEYFGLRLESQLTLADNEAPGWYQLSTLADDGAIIYLKNPDGSLTKLVNDDGTHSTKMACASNAIYLDHTSKIPIVVQYYQGPRYHISLVVMWRLLAEGEDPAAPAVDSQCGKAGNSMYFDSTKVPSEPTATYYDLLTRGWKPLTNENYYFPEQASNPCATEDPLLITSFAINSTTRTSVTISWNSSLAATTKAEVKNVTTGAIISTLEDMNLTTNHTVTIPGLTASTLYSVKGISTSAGGQTVSSSESAFRTPR